MAPICIDYNYEFEEKVVPFGWLGRVAGWGFDQSNDSAHSTLKIIDLTVIERNECRKKLDWYFRLFLTPDKYCARNLRGAGLCPGDSGGGLAFRVTDEYTGQMRYYLRGIVSTGPNNGENYDSDKLTTFTNPAHISDFVFFHEVIYRPIVGKTKFHLIRQLLRFSLEKYEN